MIFITHREEEDLTIVEVEGALDSSTGADFESYIDKLISNGYNNIILSMEGLQYLSSEGIGATIVIHKKIHKSNGRVIFCNLNEEIKKLFRILSFNEIFTITDSIEEAKEAFTENDKPLSKKSEDLRIDKNLIFPEEKNSEEIFPVDDIEPVLYPDESVEIEEKSNYEIESFDRDYMEEFIVECPKCLNLIKINATGNHFCPHCSAQFTVERSGRVLFKIEE